jgi:Leucine-rich repeat (LRR) protein
MCCYLNYTLACCAAVDPCEWAGVTCTAGRVTALSLPFSTGAKLTGSLAPELATLSELQTLNLFNNSLTGPLPPEWGGLPALQSLNLGSNFITGALPASWATLPALQRLDLSFNNFGNTVSRSQRSSSSYVW